VGVVQNPFFMLFSELPNFIRNHLHLKFPMEIGVSDIPKCINDVPNYLVLKSLRLDVHICSFAIKITSLRLNIITF